MSDEGVAVVRSRLQQAIAIDSSMVAPLTDDEVKAFGGPEKLASELIALPPEHQRRAVRLLAVPSVRAGVGNALAPDLMKRWDAAPRNGVISLSEVVRVPGESIRRDLASVPAGLRGLLVTPALAAHLADPKSLPTQAQMFDHMRTLMLRQPLNSRGAVLYLDAAAQIVATDDQRQWVADSARQLLALKSDPATRSVALAAWSKIAAAEEAPTILSLIAQTAVAGNAKPESLMEAEARVAPERRDAVMRQALDYIRDPKVEWDDSTQALRVLALDTDPERRQLAYDFAMERQAKTLISDRAAIALDVAAQLAQTPEQRKDVLDRAVAIYSDFRRTYNEARRIALRTIARLTDDPEVRRDIARVAMFHFDPGSERFDNNDRLRGQSLLAAATAIRE